MNMSTSKIRTLLISKEFHDSLANLQLDKNMKRYFTSIVGSKNSKTSDIGSNSIPNHSVTPSISELPGCEVEVDVEVDKLCADSGLRKGVDVDNLLADPGGGDSFFGQGYRNWKKKDRLDAHVGSHNSVHSMCVHACEDLMSQQQHVDVCLSNYSEQSQIDYRAGLIAFVECIRSLLLQELALRGHDESDNSNARGCIVERFLGKVHVSDTTTRSLKMSIEGLLCKYGLFISSLRGQCYDGASNMRGEFNGLKSLIMMENESAYLIHCFAHQLQLALAIVATSHFKINEFFNFVSMLTNIVGASCKRKDMLREKSVESLLEGLLEGEILYGTGKNQEVSLGRATAMHWVSHYRTLINLTILFDPTIEVRTAIVDENVLSQRVQAESILRVIQNFEFVFCLFPMKNIFEVTNELSQAIQRKDQDIVNALSLVKVTK